jgi:hypothetical protein
MNQGARDAADGVADYNKKTDKEKAAIMSWRGSHADEIDRLMAVLREEV